jgi:hypothetical protein
MPDPSSPDDRAARTDGGGDTGGDETDDAVDGPAIERLLLSEGIVEEMPDADDLQLTDAFERAWRERIERIREGDRAVRWLAATMDANPDDVTVESGRARTGSAQREDGDSGSGGEGAGGRFVVAVDGRRHGWPSEASFVASVVAEPTLAEFVPDSRWAEFPEETRERVAAQLLLFLERCPACDGPLRMTDEPAETDGSTETGGSDGGENRVRLACESCGAAVVDECY